MPLINPTRRPSESQIEGFVEDALDRRRWRQVVIGLRKIKSDDVDDTDGVTARERVIDQAAAAAVRCREIAEQMDTYVRGVDTEQDSAAETDLDAVIAKVGIGAVARALRKKAGPTGQLTDRLRISRRNVGRRRQV